MNLMKKLKQCVEIIEKFEKETSNWKGHVPRFSKQYENNLSHFKFINENIAFRTLV